MENISIVPKGCAGYWLHGTMHTCQYGGTHEETEQMAYRNEFCLSKTGFKKCVFFKKTFEVERKEEIRVPPVENGRSPWVTFICEKSMKSMEICRKIELDKF